MVSVQKVTSTEPPNWQKQVTGMLSAMADLALSIIALPHEGIKRLSCWMWKPQETAMAAILHKMRHSVAIGVIKECHKLTLAEFDQLRHYEMGAKLPEEQALIKAYEQLLSNHKKEPYIRLSFHVNESWIQRGFMPYKHVNFVMFDGSGISVHSMQKKGLYHKEISGRFSPKMITHEIDVERLMPAGLNTTQKEAYKTKFYEELAKIITKPGEGLVLPTIPAVHYLKRFFAPGSSTVELFLNSNEKRQLWCSEFVFQALVEAHVHTCKAVNSAPFKTLPEFGVRHSVALTPDRLQSALLAKKILKPALDPLVSSGVS